jgi:DNA-binding LacI/PurR family transcriptional regulator
MLTKPLKKPSKLEAVCAQVRALAHQLGPGAKLPTVAQLCATTGVSLTTMSSALDELEAHEVIARKHGVGIFVAATLRKTICLICDPSYFGQAGQSPFWDLLITNVQKRVAKRAEAFEFHFSQPRGVGLNESLQHEIRSGRIQGILAVGLDRPVVEWIEEQGVPVVVYAAWGQCMVGNNAEHGIQLGIRALALRGCSRIEMWEGLNDVPSRRTSPRTRVFQKTLQHLKLAHAASQIRYCTQTDGIDWSNTTLPEQGYHLAQHTFSQPREQWPDGIIINNDMLTVGVLRGLQNLSVRVGEDVQIATHANRGSPALVGYEYKLVLLEFDPGELTAAMFSILEELMAGHQPTNKIVRIEAKLLEPALTIARSAA